MAKFSFRSMLRENGITPLYGSHYFDNPFLEAGIDTLEMLHHMQVPLDPLHKMGLALLTIIWESHNAGSLHDYLKSLDEQDKKKVPSLPEGD